MDLFRIIELFVKENLIIGVLIAMIFFIGQLFIKEQKANREIVNGFNKTLTDVISNIRVIEERTKRIESGIGAFVDVNKGIADIKLVLAKIETLVNERLKNKS